MKRAIVFFVCGLVAGALFLSGPVSSQEGEEKDPHAKFGRDMPSEAEQGEMMKKWQEAMTPGKFHERLGYFVGSWDTVTKMWMGGEGSGPGQASNGKATFRWLMEGRWVSQELEGTMMGAPYKGFGINGYDNFRKRYVGCWIDNMGTALLTMEGGIDRTGKVIEEYGPMDEPMLAQAGKTVKYVTRITDDDHFAFEIHDLDIIGGHTKVIEIAYTRKK